jgi:hypothetical protein
MGGKKAQYAYVGETVKPTILTTGAEGATVVWTSGNEAIATVDANGVVTAVAPGATSITASVTVGGETVSVTFAMTVIATDSYFLAFNNKTNTWEKVDRQNPENITVIEGSTTEAALKVVENVGGVLYAYDVEGNFYTIDAKTLVATKMGVLDMSGMNEIIDLAYDALNGRLLALIDDEYGFSSIYEVNTVTGALDLVSAGLGVTIIPEECIQTRENVRYIPLLNRHQALYLCIVYDRWLDPPVWDFVEKLIKSARKAQ